MEGLTLEDLRKLRHMLGMTYERKNWGFRNYYATSGGEAMLALDRLVTMGYVVKSGTSDCGMSYYHATENGCIAAGLNAKQTKRALEE